VYTVEFDAVVLRFIVVHSHTVPTVNGLALVAQMANVEKTSMSKIHVHFNSIHRNAELSQ
jgi:hypothetical protein